MNARRDLASVRQGHPFRISVSTMDEYSIALFTTKGLEGICVDEFVDVTGCSRSNIHIGDKVVLVRQDVQPKKLRALRTVDDVGVVLAQPAVITTEAEYRTYIRTHLTREMLLTAAEVVAGFDATFSITASVARSPVGSGHFFDKILSDHIAAATGWRSREHERAALDVRIFVDRTWLFVARRLFESPLTLRSYRLANARGALRPTVAAAMVRLTPARHGGRRLWDPYCGSGTILAEAALLGNKVWGTDIDDEAVSTSRQNVGVVDRHSWTRIARGDSTTQAEWRRHEACDVVIANIPWGKQIDIVSARALYDSLAIGCSALLSRGGTACILTTDAERLKSALKRTTSAHPEEHRLGLLGQTPCIVLVSGQT